MEFTFYTCGLIAILATLRVVTLTNPIHALLYLIVSLLAISGIFFSLGAYFIGALEIIIYAGAIIVLFVFVVMTLNVSEEVIRQERQWMKLKTWINPLIFSIIAFVIILFAIFSSEDKEHCVSGTALLSKEIGKSLFGPYILIVELTSMLLLAALVVIFHIGHEKK